MAPWAFLAVGAAVVALLALPRERRRTTTNGNGNEVKVRLPSGSCRFEDWGEDDLAAVQMKVKDIYGDMGSPPSIGPGAAVRITHDLTLRVARVICPDETWPELDLPVYKREAWYKAAPKWQKEIWDLIWNVSWFVVIKRGQ